MEFFNGHDTDWKNMGNIVFGVLKDLVLGLATQAGIKNFVETGTYQANTALWAAGHFQQAHTIEAAKPLYDAAVSKFGKTANLHFHNGDSRDCLRQIQQSLDGPALYWLDAHWSGGVTFGQGDECPLLSEIEVVNQGSVDSIILIDDARLFLSPPPKPHDADQWPDLLTVLSALAQPKPRRFIIVHQDVIVAVPQKHRRFLIDWVRDHPTPQ
jgi:hypothetical protein